jgi:hypothetical protein
LGESEGAPVEFDWVPPSPLPGLIPWLGVLLLLALPFNRATKAWWIWVPLLVVTASESLFRPQLEFIPSSVLTIFCLAFNSLAFGTAAVWLLAPHLHHRLRFVGFLKLLGMVAGATILAYLVRADWDSPAEAVGFLFVVGIFALVAAVSLRLAGLTSRGRYQPLALALWLAVLVAGLWMLIASPFVLLAAATGNSNDWPELLQVLLSFATLTYAVLLPFLVLAFANSWYRERLKALLGLSQAGLTPPTAPPNPANAPDRRTP